MKSILFSILVFGSLSVIAQPFHCIVAADGTGTNATIQSAIDACPEGEQSLVFIKNGIYDEQVTIGSKTVASTKKISLIGESATGVIITHNQSRASSGSPTFEDICTVKIYTNDFYAENITIQNTAGNTGMAEALYTAGDRQTFKNCRILGYQDTYRSKKGTRGYFLNCWIEGAVDFIYAGGVEFFDNCTINCVNGGGYITAPEDAYTTIPKASTVCQKFLRVGFFFRNCDITANSDVANNSFYLGRPWAAMAGSFYLNCKLGKHINPVGWKEWSGNETSSSFAEYNSMDLNGMPVDTTKRVSWSFQLPKADVDNLLSPQSIYARVSTTVYDPITICISPNAPTNVNARGHLISWENVAGVAGYLIYKNDKFLGSVSETNFTDTTNVSGIYTVRSISTLGVLSNASTATTALFKLMESSVKVSITNGTISFSEPVIFNIFNLNGQKVFSMKQYNNSATISNLSKGFYLLELTDSTKKARIIKIEV